MDDDNYGTIRVESFNDISYFGASGSSGSAGYSGLSGVSGGVVGKSEWNDFFLGNNQSKKYLDDLSKKVYVTPEWWEHKTFTYLPEKEDHINILDEFKKEI